MLEYIDKQIISSYTEKIDGSDLSLLLIELSLFA